MGTFTVEVSWDGVPVSGVTAVSPLRSSTEVITLRDGTGIVRHAPGRTDSAVVTVSRELGSDLAFDLWARGPVLRKVVDLTLANAVDGVTVTYRLPDCWVAGYAVEPDVGTGTVVESLSLSTGPWQRVTPPVADLAAHLPDHVFGGRPGPVVELDVASLLATLESRGPAELEARLSRAEESGAVLLLEEADALFARRAEVADAHDRYADIGVDALLQRLSAYRGQVLVEPPPAWR